MEAGCTQDPSNIRLALLFCLACLCLQGDAICTAGIHVPKLAMLFLARGGMPLEDIWKPWFSSVGGLVPTNLVKEQFCDSHDVAAVHSLECDLMNPNVRPNQWLPIYGPDFESRNGSSIDPDETWGFTQPWVKSCSRKLCTRLCITALASGLCSSVKGKDC